MADASARLVNATILDNGTGVDAQGTVDGRNALVTANDVGLSAGAGGRITSRYSDVFGDATADRLHAIWVTAICGLPFASPTRPVQTRASPPGCP
jgi:hypothetical protein